jgi:hypothetical protein
MGVEVFEIFCLQCGRSVGIHENPMKVICRGCYPRLPRPRGRRNQEPEKARKTNAGGREDLNNAKSV